MDLQQQQSGDGGSGWRIGVADPFVAVQIAAIQPRYQMAQAIGIWTILVRCKAQIQRRQSRTLNVAFQKPRKLLDFQQAAFHAQYPVTAHQFGDQGATAFVRGQLESPVIVVGVQGVDRKPLDAFRQLLLSSGARLQGTVLFTSKLELSNPDDVRALQAIVGVPTARSDLLRRAMATRLAEGWLPGGAPTVLPALRDAGFVEFEPPSGEPVDLAAVPPAGTLTVLVSGPSAEVPNAEVAQPFVTSLVIRAANSVLVAEAGREATADAPAQRAVFLSPILDDEAIANRLSTVDNLEEVRGRVAAVLALVGLVEGKTGHYGTGRGAQRLVPEVGP